MKNWEVLQKKISSMSEKEFTEFAIIHLNCRNISKVLTTKNRHCFNCEYYKTPQCKMTFLYQEYKPSYPYNKSWIVHRTLRKQDTEVYIGYSYTKTYMLFLDDRKVFTTYIKDSADKYTYDVAVSIRDELNKDRVGKQYLWVISEVKNGN